jgi:hypothetical protein
MKKVTRFLLGFTVLGLLVSGLGQAHAQSNGLGIAPRKDYSVQPGQSVKDTVYVSNLSKDQPLDLLIRLVDFKAQDETGSPALDRRPNAEPTPYSAKPFINVPTTLKIDPGKSVQMPISITIPANQVAGSYYSAIEYEAQTAGGGRVSVAASSATLVFVRVPGEAKELLRVEQFGTYQSDDKGENGKFKSLFSAKPPRELAFRLKNEGNVAEQPAGSIVIKNSFGHKVAVIDDANPKKSLALLGQTRRFQTCMLTEKQSVKSEVGDSVQVDVCKAPSLKPGRYTAELTLLYGENGSSTREITAKAVFWYLPVWFLIVVGLVVVALVGGGFWGYRRLTRRTRHRR